jgi:hypothetical protein
VSTSIITVRGIIQVVASFYGFRDTDILSQRRNQELVHARQVAAYLATRLTAQSAADIGRRIGRDHSTVLHTLRVIEARREDDAEFAEELLQLEAIIAATFQARERVSVEQPPDLDATAIATRVLDNPRGVTSISTDELIALATAVTAAPEATEELPASLWTSRFAPASYRELQLASAARALLAALQAQLDATYADRGAVLHARQDVRKATEMLVAALDGGPPEKKSHPTSKEKTDGQHVPAHG